MAKGRDSCLFASARNGSMIQSACLAVDNGDSPFGGADKCD